MFGSNQTERGSPPSKGQQKKSKSSEQDGKIPIHTIKNLRVESHCRGQAGGGAASEGRMNSGTVAG